MILFVTTSLYSQIEKRYVVLWSSNGKDTTEVYAVTASRLSNLPDCNPLLNILPLSIDSAISVAERYIKRRYPEDRFVFGSISLTHFADSVKYFTTGHAKDWVYIVQFEYNEKGYSQAVPVLLDGSVIYSGKEGFR
jgi:hypothetical protein